MTDKSIKKLLIYGIAFTLSAAVLGLFISPWCALLCLCLGGGICTLFVYNTKKLNNQLNALNEYLALICAGHFDLDIADNSEGELSIMKNNLYKVILLLRSQNEQLKKDRTFLADSLADISHQLKTPLTSMLVMTELLQEQASTKRQSECLSIMSGQLDKMNWLISNLLKLSKLDAGTAPFKNEPFSLKAVLHQSLEPLTLLLEIKEITLRDESEDFTACGDDGWTAEAITNILKNCLEHTDRGGEIRLSTTQSTIYNSLFIEDNGCGIAKEDLPHIFERFYHGKNSAKESVGIGLALAKTVLEKEKGVITAESRENEGSKFEIRFYKAIV